VAHKLGTGGREWREGEMMVQVAYTGLDVVCCHRELENKNSKSHT